MSALTGTGRLLRLAARRDRVLVPAWLVAITGLAAAVTASLVGLYTTEQERAAAAAFSANSPVTRAFDGPASGTDLGALVVMEAYWLLAVLVGILCAQAVVRHTRLDEETGRAELVGAAVVGREARLAAALVWSGLVALLAGGLVTVVLLGAGLAPAGSVLVGSTLAGNGVVFAGVAAVAAQVASGARVANGIVGGAMGLAFLLRALGDATGEVADSGVEVVSAWPSWLSPIGWGQQARAFHEDDVRVLWLFGVTAVVLVAVAAVLSSRRDLGAGLVAARPGPARGGLWLTSPLGLAWRLQRGALVAWTVALAVVGAAFGAVGESADDIVGVSAQFEEALRGLGDGGILELYFAFAVGFLAVAASGFVVQALLRLRAEETRGRLEAVLATATSRHAWIGAHVLVAAVGAAVVLIVMGASGTLAYGLLTGAWDVGLRGMLGAALAHLPATLVLGGVVLLAVAVVPRWAAAIGWAAFAASLILGQLGALLDLPQAVLNVSPFTHVPAVPAEPLAWGQLVVLIAVAVALSVAALAAFRRRDLVLTS